MIRLEDFEEQEEREGNPVQGILYAAGLSLVLWLLILYAACGGFSS